MFLSDKNHKINGFSSPEMQLFPSIINVEIYRGNCQCRCVHCPIGVTHSHDREKKYGLQHMEPRLYKKIIDEVTHYPRSILRLYSVGEPSLWNYLYEALILTANKGIKTWIFTNGVTHDRSLLGHICHYTRIIEVSINSIDGDDYMRTKGIDAFDQVVSNIQWMRNEILKNRFNTRLIVSRVESNNKELDKNFIHYWKKSGLVNDAIVRSYNTYNGLVDNISKGEEKVFQKNFHEPCLVHWARFNIGINGNVIVCLNELFRDSIEPACIFGNIFDQSIKEIWQSTRMNELRLAELTQEYFRCHDWEKLPCRHCNSCQPLYGKQETSEHQISQLE